MLKVVIDLGEEKKNYMVLKLTPSSGIPELKIS